MGLGARRLAFSWMLLAIIVGCGSESDGPTATATGTAGGGGKGGSGGGAGMAGAGTAGSPAEAGPDTGAGGSKMEAGPSTDAMDEWLDAAAEAAGDGGGAPPTLSATGFFKSIGADGGVVLGDGVRALRAALQALVRRSRQDEVGVPAAELQDRQHRIRITGCCRWAPSSGKSSR